MDDNKNKKAAESNKQAANKDNKDTKNTAADKAPAPKKEREKKEILDELIDEGDLILENIRISYDLTPSNARFFRSKGGLVSLELTIEDKEPEFFERVMVLRAFPVSNPDEFLSVREPGGKEIGMVRRISDFDEKTVMLLLEELDRRYFAPEIIRIISRKEKFGYLYFETETSAGPANIVISSSFSQIRTLEDGRVVINDIEGNSFEIPDPKKLDPASYKRIEIYI